VGLEIRFQAPDRSLTDEELQPMLSHMLSDFEAAFGAKLKNVSND
jgi:phenylalanyl-tRNA synthetase beta subunit